MKKILGEKGRRMHLSPALTEEMDQLTRGATKRKYNAIFSRNYNSIFST